LVNSVNSLKQYNSFVVGFLIALKQALEQELQELKSLNGDNLLLRRVVVYCPNIPDGFVFIVITRV
jgi:hypothetical protein